MKIAVVALVVVAAVLLVGALAAGPSIAGGLSGLGSDHGGTEVRTEPAARGELVETVSAPGEIEPHTRVQISAEVSARILELPLREGQEVKEGDIVARLNDRDLKAALLSSRARRDGERFRLQADKARLDGLITTLEFARRELERQQTLYESGDVSRRDYDNVLERVQDLESSVEATTYSISVVESSLAAAEADIERAEDGLANTVIAAPMDGTITVLNVEVGEVVTGSTTNPGTVLMTIADLSRMVLKLQVAESDIADVKVGQRAKIYVNAYPDDVFSGTVRQIALQRAGNPDGTGYFRTEVELELQGRRIYSGLVANVDIEIENHDGIVVPYQAIVVRDVENLPDDVRRSPLVDTTKRKANVVYRVVDGKATVTPVKAGPSDLTHRIVEEGLDEGAEVVIGPYKVLESIAHDEKVSVKGDAAADTDANAGADTDADTDADAESPDTAP